MDEAWEALLDERLPLAEKLARRAIDGSEMNPRLWLDVGRILYRCGHVDESEEALRRAIAIAPTHGEAFAELARLQAAVGKWVQAERLQRRAVELLPHDAAAPELLASYAAMLPPVASAAIAATPTPHFTERTERFHWEDVAAELRVCGGARLPQLLAVHECDALRRLWEDGCFEHAVVLDAPDAGRLEYRFFQRPLPVLVQELRTEVYARLAPIANDWHRQLARRTTFPVSLAEFLARCVEAGQHRSTPILLRYPPGGFNAPHRDVAGRVVFPFQLAVALGPHSFATAGGALRLVDVRGRRERARQFVSEPGDGVIFCTHERLVQIAGVTAAQPVRHAVGDCAAERFALGVPFHEHG